MLEKVGDGLEADGESASERGSTPAIAAKTWVKPAWVESLLDTSLDSIATCGVGRSMENSLQQ